MNKTAYSISSSNLFNIISIIFDVVSIVYFFWFSFWLTAPLIPFEIALGLFFLIEYIILFLATDNKKKYILHPLAISNILIIIGYLAAPFYNLGFLRLLRALRVIHLYQLIPDIRSLNKSVVVWERLFTTLVHVVVLIFIFTEIILILQSDINQDINNRFDAFYFTTNAITKVGSGETIELIGTQGKILTLIIAFLSLSVFVQLLDTAKDVQRLNKERRKKKKLTEKELDQLYKDQLCIYCDIKQRDLN